MSCEVIRLRPHCHDVINVYNATMGHYEKRHVDFEPWRRKAVCGSEDTAGTSAGDGERLSHSSNNCRPMLDSSSVPSRDILTSRPWFHGFRKCFVRENDRGSVQIQSTRNGRPRASAEPSFGASRSFVGSSATVCKAASRACFRVSSLSLEGVG